MDECPKCHGTGWVWGRELDNPSENTSADTMTRYSCDSDICKAQQERHCQYCDSIGYHSYDCVVKWRARRANRDKTYTTNNTCGNCMFFHVPMAWDSRYSKFGECGLPVTDHDDEVMPQKGRKIIEINGTCAEYRDKTDPRQSDRPWSSYPIEWLRYKDEE